MSEEEILKECTELAENEHHELGDCWDEEYSSSAVFGLIMLYKQTKKELNNLKEIEKSHQEENGKLRKEIKELEEIKADYIRRMKCSNEVLRKQGYISKDKIKEKLEKLKETKEEIASRNNYILLKDNKDTEIYNLYKYFTSILEELLEEK